jgi:hypothetical protein
VAAAWRFLILRIDPIEIGRGELVMGLDRALVVGALRELDLLLRALLIIVYVVVVTHGNASLLF